jgi:hypothetical protein
MTLRDYFAGQALAYTLGLNYGNDWGKFGVDHNKKAVAMALTIADEMLAQRQK